MRRSGVHPDHHTFPAINRAVASLPGHLPLGEAIHSLGVKTGLDLDIYFCNTMIEVYSKHGRSASARLLFDKMPERDVVSWTSFISGVSRSGNAVESLSLFQKMLAAGLRPNSATMLVLLRSFSSADHLPPAKQLHGFSIKEGLLSFDPVRNSIMATFCRIGDLEEAEGIFAVIVEKDLVAWNIMISGYCSSGDSSVAIESLNRMKISLSPSPETLTLVVSSCTKNRDLRTGEELHGHAMKLAPIDDTLQACLLDLYIKCGEPAAARRIFRESRPQSRHHLWSTMISGVVLAGGAGEAAQLFREMQVAGAELAAGVVRSILRACADEGSLLPGKSVHGFLLRTGWCGGGEKTSLQTALLSMYARCGSIILAERCFRQIRRRDQVAWSSMIEGYAANGLGPLALNLFCRMVREGIRPNEVTFLSVLSACSHAGLVEDGCRVFAAMARDFGVNPAACHLTCLVDLLGRAGMLEEALRVVRSVEGSKEGNDARMWGALLAACKNHGGAASLGAYVAEKVLELEPGNMGYGVVLCNIHSAAGRWVEAAERRRGLVKEPGWSSLEVGGD